MTEKILTKQLKQVSADDNLGNSDVLLPTQRAVKRYVDKTSVPQASAANKVYGTDSEGNQTTYSKEEFGKVDDVRINDTSIVENKIANITVDGVVQSDSLNPVQSGAVFDALAGKQDSLPSLQAGKFLTNDGENLSWETISSGMTYKGQIDTVADLPETATVGDFYNCIENGKNYIWNGESWDELATPEIDETNLVHKTGAETIAGNKTFTAPMVIQTNNTWGLDVQSPSSGGYLYVTRGSGSRMVRFALKAGINGGTMGTDTNDKFSIRVNNINKMTFEKNGDIKLAANPASTSNDTQIATTKWVNDKLATSSIYIYKGTVETLTDLEDIENPAVGDVYFVSDESENYAWNGTTWGPLGGTFEIDDALSTTSENSVQNKIITAAINEKADAVNTPDVNTYTVEDGYLKVTPQAAQQGEELEPVNIIGIESDPANISGSSDTVIASSVAEDIYNRLENVGSDVKISGSEGIDIVDGFENDEYIQIDYIETDGTQYVNLGRIYTPQSNFTVKFQIDSNDLTSRDIRSIYGFYPRSIAQDYGGWALQLGSVTSGSGTPSRIFNAVYPTSSTSGSSVTLSLINDSWHTVRFTHYQVQIDDGLYKPIQSDTTSEFDVDMILFGHNYGTMTNDGIMWEPYPGFKGKIEYFRVSHQNESYQDVDDYYFIAVRKKADNTLGFYDTINNVFYPIIATGDTSAVGGEDYNKKVIKINTGEFVPFMKNYCGNRIDPTSTGDLTKFYNTTYGNGTSTNGSSNVLIGNGASSDSPSGYSTVVGAAASDTASSGYGTVIGYRAITTGTQSIAVGSNATAYGSGSVVLGGNTTANGANSINIGNHYANRGATYYSGPYTIAIGYQTQPNKNYGIAIGNDARLLADYSIAIGFAAKSGLNGVAIGSNATTGNYSYSIAIGNRAQTEGTGAIQLGDGNNTTPGTFNVGLRTSDDSSINVQLLDSGGKIPVERLGYDSPTGGQIAYYNSSTGRIGFKDEGSSYELPTATSSRLGGIKVGSGLSVASDGTLSANVQSLAFEDIQGDPYDNSELETVFDGFQNNLDTVQGNLDLVENNLQSQITLVENNLQTQIDSLSSIGQFLAIWDCDTAIARYLNNGYQYQAGNYFIIGTVAAQGQPNYMPNGASYPGSAVTTEDVKVSDMWFYDGTNWVYLANHERAIAVDRDLSTTSTNPVENATITSALEDKQDTLTAGKGITIADNVISASGDSVGVPQIANVYAAQLNSASEAANRIEKEAMLGFYSDICFNLNLTKEQILDKMDELYIGLERFKRNRVTSGIVDPEDPDSEEIEYRNIANFKVQNDHFVHTDQTMYCYRYIENEDYSQSDPRRFAYFYSNNKYSSYEDMLQDDPSIFCFYGAWTQGNQASCLNTLREVGVFSNIEEGSETWHRYAPGDIEVFVNVNKNDSISGGYIRQRKCRQYTNLQGNKEYLWCDDWTDPAADVYSTSDRKIPDSFTNNISVVGQVSDWDNVEYKQRSDLNYWNFDLNTYDLSEWIEAVLEPATLQGKPWGDETLHTSWLCYWLDYPLQPVLLQDCEVLLNGDEWIKLKTAVKNEMDLPENLVFRFPYNTAELWLRFSAWQKRCMYNEYKEESDEHLPLRQKTALAFAWEWNMGSSVTGKRAFGRQRNKYSGTSDNTKICEYIQFNLYEPYNVYGGTKSKSTPIKKRLVINNLNGSSGLRD